MEGGKSLLAKLLFGEESGIELERIVLDEGGIEISARTIRSVAACPVCSVGSDRVHSRYLRTLSDVPLAQQRVSIRLLIRRFFCRNSDCQRRVFTEPLPGLARSRSRSTQRLSGIQQQLGLALGGEAGSRLARSLSMPASADTLLRRVAELVRPKPGALRVIGVDDWAMRRGQRYGTLVCDLERRRPVAILPNRSAETLAQWLKEHPDIEIISRDRSGDYSKGAAQGAPQARQVADRWHLLKNVQNALQKAVELKLRLVNELLRKVSTPSSAEPATEPVRLVQEADQAPEHAEALSERSQSQAARIERYEMVNQLAKQGMGQRAITRKTGLSRKTVRRFMQSESYPEHRIGRRPGRINRYAAVIKSLWDDGFHSARQIHA